MSARRLLSIAWPLAVALSLVTACSGWRGHGDTYYARKPLLRGKVADEATFSFGMPPAGEWKPAREKGAQVLWSHASMPAVIHLMAQCERHGDSSLEAFTDHLRIDFRDWEIVEQERLTIAERDAVRTVVDAAIDGVARTRIEMIVVKKDGCLFDLQYIAAPEVFERGRPAFRAVVADFKFPIREG